VRIPHIMLALAVVENDRSHRLVGSLSKAFRLLTAFSAERPELGATELATATGLDRTTIHRFLTTLAQIGALTQNPATRKYRLGLHLLDFAYALLDSLEIRRIAVPYLLSLQLETRKAVTLGVPDATDVLLIERLWGPEVPVNLTMQIGARLPMYASAMGRSILAYSEPALVEQALRPSQLRKLTPKTETDGARILRRLQQVRTQGFDVADEEIHLGARAVAAPIRGSDGSAVGAICLTAQTSISMAVLVERYARRLSAAGLDISIALGYRGRQHASLTLLPRALRSPTHDLSGRQAGWQPIRFGPPPQPSRRSRVARVSRGGGSRGGRAARGRRSSP